MERDDDIDEPDPFARLEPPRDPVHDDDAPDHPGVVLVRDALSLLRRGRAEEALDRAEQAVSAPLPAEIVPHAAVAHGAALIACGRAGDAMGVLGLAWRDHPDIAVLPILLGVAASAQSEPERATHAFVGGLAVTDPDRTLELYRWLVWRVVADRS